MDKNISEIIKDRIVSSKGNFFANENISEYLKEGELDLLKTEIEAKVKEVLKSLVIDVKNDPNTQETAKRITKMYLEEVFKGRYQECPEITSFPNQRYLKQMYALGPIPVRSTCSHHFVPIMGDVWVGVLPGERIVGISKFSRIVDWVMSRPHIQEEAVVLLADTLEKELSPQGLGLMIKCKHYCMSWRGVKNDDTLMTNILFRGKLLENDILQKQFYELLKGRGAYS